MISKAASTKDWAPTEQKSSFRADTNQYVGAEVIKKQQGDKDIGDILNQAADPSWVDPAKMRKGVGSDELNKDAFFKLMLAQIKAQDPMNPMQSHEMAAHLAQFTSLEQLYNVNENLKTLGKGQDMLGYQALNFIGKSISADTSKITRVKGDNAHEIRFDVKGDAQAVRIEIFDQAGQKVKSMELGPHKKGEQRVTWNGIGDDGSVSRAGEYNFKIEAKGSDEKKIHVATQFNGKVTGVNFTSQGPVLMMGDQSIRLSDIKKIEDSDLKQSEGARAPGIAGAIPKTAIPGSGIQVSPLKSEPAAAAPVEPVVPGAEPALVSNLEPGTMISPDAAKAFESTRTVAENKIANKQGGK